MLYGHIGVALAAKPLAPKAPTGAMLAAATLIDILCGIFIIAGIEGTTPDGTISMPWSHGMLMSGIWTLATYIITRLVSHNKKTSLILALLVFSHWVLDFISHPMGLGKVIPPDMPLLFDNSPKVGLGLYNSVIAAFVTDFGLLAAGITIFLLKSKPENRNGKWALGALFLFMFTFPLAYLLPGKLSMLTIILQVFFIPLGYWVDKNMKFKGFCNGYKQKDI